MTEIKVKRSNMHVLLPRASDFYVILVMGFSTSLRIMKGGRPLAVLFKTKWGKDMTSSTPLFLTVLGRSIIDIKRMFNE